MCIDILESLPSFCPKVVVAFRGIESYASKLLVMMVNIMTMMTMIQMTIMMMNMTMMIWTLSSLELIKRSLLQRLPQVAFTCAA